MSVLIKGMKMPKGCLGCPCINAKYNECMILQRRATDVMTRMTDCPLVELPDHGDLIDREALVALWEKDIVDNKESGITDYAYTDIEQIYREFIYDAKMFRAVIPAERSEE